MLFPLVFLLNSRLAFMVLIAAIAWNFFARTRSPKRTNPLKRSRSEEQEYQAGYEN